MKRTDYEERSGFARRETRVQQLSELQMTYEGADGAVPIRLPDISPHGMFVNTSTQFPEGAIVNLRFRLTRSNVEVQTRSEVRYCLAGIGIGVEFIGIGADARRAIEAEMEVSIRPGSQKKLTQRVAAFLRETFNKGVTSGN